MLHPVHSCASPRLQQVPHAFQQKLSSEKTPTLHETLPSFQQIIAKWKEYKDEMPDYELCIDAGLSKLQDYFSQAMKVPAYQLAICKVVFGYFLQYTVTNYLYYIYQYFIHQKSFPGSISTYLIGFSLFVRCFLNM